jgi:hypothetical protein
VETRMSYLIKRCNAAYEAPKTNWNICKPVRVRFSGCGTRKPSAEQVK